MKQGFRVVVVEDEQALRDETVAYLQHLGHSVTGVGSGDELNAALSGNAFDVAILDVLLPGEDGFSIARRLRETTSLGIIMLTAHGALGDRIKGFEAGADAYLPKPAEFKELAAILAAVGSRVTAAKPSDTPADPRAGDTRPEEAWVFDRVKWALISPQGRLLELTGTELGFIAELVQVPGSPVSRAVLIQALHGPRSDYDPRALDSLVRRLRRKAEEMCNEPLPVRAFHGLGYVFTAPLIQR